MKKPQANSGEAGANADQVLLDVARTELERDCFKNAEQAVRKKLKQLQRFVARAQHN